MNYYSGETIKKALCGECRPSSKCECCWKYDVLSDIYDHPAKVVEVEHKEKERSEN